MLFRGGYNRNLTFTRLFAFVSPFVCVAKLILRLPTWIAFLECTTYYVKSILNTCGLLRLLHSILTRGRIKPTKNESNFLFLTCFEITKLLHKFSTFGMN